MIYSLVLCLDVGQLMLTSLSDNFKKIFSTKIKTFLLLSLILKRLSINASYIDGFDVKVGVHHGSGEIQFSVQVVMHGLTRSVKDKRLTYQISRVTDV